LAEVKRLLADPRYDHFTLLALAFEAGFSSKTTFNTYFKEKTGLTPSVYRKQKRA